MIANIDPIQPGDAASPNLWNSRFAIVTTVLNGNVDADNLKNGAVTREKIASGSVTSDKIDTDRYVDANGWTVNDLGTTKTYSYVYNISNVSIPFGTRKDNLPAINVPVGRTRDNLVFSATWYGGYAGHAIPGIESADGSKIRVMLGNQYAPANASGNLTFNGKIFITAVEQI